MTIDLDRAVLLPIDMQQAFDGSPWPRRWNDRVDTNGIALLAAWREAGRPIIHVRHDSVQPGSSLAPGAPGNAFRPAFEPRDGGPCNHAKVEQRLHHVMSSPVESLAQLVHGLGVLGIAYSQGTLITASRAGHPNSITTQSNWR